MQWTFPIISKPILFKLDSSIRSKLFSPGVQWGSSLICLVLLPEETGVTGENLWSLVESNWTHFYPWLQQTLVTETYTKVMTHLSLKCTIECGNNYSFSFVCQFFTEFNNIWKLWNNSNTFSDLLCNTHIY
jgi:hypothetical protein